MIVHAAGLADGIEHTNSVEALQQSYAAGARLIELDFNFTSDGYLACVHDWDRRFSSAITTGVPPSLQAYLNSKIFDKFTPMWLGTVADFMYQYTDLYIVTDVKDRNIDAAREIKKLYPNLMDRFIIKVYSKTEYFEIKSLVLSKSSLVCIK